MLQFKAFHFSWRSAVRAALAMIAIATVIAVSFVLLNWLVAQFAANIMEK
jgi:hypothetical protein